MPACEEFQGLLMGLIDRELVPGEARRVNDHLLRCAACREEYEELRRASKSIEAVSFAEPSDEALGTLWNRPYSRFAQNSGMILVLVGWLALICYGMYEFFMDKSEAAIPKLATAAVCIGIAILLISVIRGRLKTYKTDPYKEVER